MERVKSILSSWRFWPSQQGIDTEHGAELKAAEDFNTDGKGSVPQIESYPAGYPQYSALISSYDFFFVFRSFHRLRARLLLAKQDELHVLEAQLDQMDRDEASPFFLGTCRDDGNAGRAVLLSQIHLKLTEYDAAMSRCRQVLSYSRANSRDTVSLRNWLEEMGCLVEDETSYLERENDLVSLASSSDVAMKRLEDWIGDRLIRYYKGFRAVRGFEASTNPSVYIYSGRLIKAIAKAMMLFLIISLLLTPVVICILVDSTPARIFIIIASTAFYVGVLAWLTKSRMIELILAGATFATVLTVFLSNSGSP